MHENSQVASKLALFTVIYIEIINTLYTYNFSLHVTAHDFLSFLVCTETCRA